MDETPQMKTAPSCFHVSGYPGGNRYVHLLSGGLDSVTILHMLTSGGCPTRCLLVDYGQKHVQELTFAQWHCRQLAVPFRTINLPPLGGLTEGGWVVPNRNAILIHIAINEAVQTGASHVSIGCNADDADMFPDCRQGFIDLINASVIAAKLDVKVVAPLIGRMKWEIGGIARNMGVDGSQIWSCYRGGSAPCGVCPACKKLSEALENDRHA